jgi:hypothetical protein
MAQIVTLSATKHVSKIKLTDLIDRIDKERAEWKDAQADRFI